MRQEGRVERGRGYIHVHTTTLRDSVEYTVVFVGYSPNVILHDCLSTGKNLESSGQYVLRIAG